MAAYMADSESEAAPPRQTAKARYEQLKTDRLPYDSRARQAALCTIPGLLPAEGSTGASELPKPWTSVGARGVNNLASKLLLTLFPPQSLFFRLEASDESIQQLKTKQGAGEDVEGLVQTALSKIEHSISVSLNSSNLRPILSEVFKHLIVAGNALLVELPDGRFKFFSLLNFCVKRDLDGNVLEILTIERLDRRTLPENARAVVQTAENDSDPEKALELFTWVSLVPGGRWKVQQEICGTIIPGSVGYYPKDKAAWLPLRWTAIAGEDYGRGHTEEYIGDHLSLESLSQSLVEASAAMAKILFLVNEGGVTEKKTLAEAPNLAMVDGDIKDVAVLSLDKALDLSVAKGQAEELSKRLEQAYLLTSSIQRDAERVTAEEIRAMAGELEQTLGGVYSTQSQELQLPLLRRHMAIMQRKGELPALPDKSIIPQIVTGLEGLGRSSDYQKLVLLIQGTISELGPTAVEYINGGQYFKLKAAALGVNTEGLIRTEDEVQQSRQATLQAQTAATLGPHAIKANAARDVAAMKDQQTGSQAA